MNQLFDLDSATNMTMDAMNSPLYRGYNSIETGAHSCTPNAQNSLHDLKESFTIGAESKKKNATNPTSLMHGPNQWPDKKHCPDFERAMRTYWTTQLDVVCVRLMQAMALSLGMENDLDFFCRECDDPVAQMVLYRYPPTAAIACPDDNDDNNNNSNNCKAPARRRQGCGEHTDCGFLTILAQDDVAGLEVKQKSNSNNNNNGGAAWVLAPPIPGTFVVNLGDMAARWTNNLYQSTEHRVYNASSSASVVIVSRSLSIAIMIPW